MGSSRLRVGREAKSAGRGTNDEREKQGGTDKRNEFFTRKFMLNFVFGASRSKNQAFRKMVEEHRLIGREKRAMQKEDKYRDEHEDPVDTWHKRSQRQQRYGVPVLRSARNDRKKRNEMPEPDTGKNVV